MKGEYSVDLEKWQGGNEDPDHERGAVKTYLDRDREIAKT